MGTERFRRRERLRKSREFREVYRQGVRVRRGAFTLHVRPNELGYDRLGMAVSRKVGPAVTRNRVKRRLRDIFRRSKRMEEPGRDLVVSAFPQAREESYWTLRDQYLSALTEAIGRLRSRGSRRGSSKPRSGPTR